MLTLSSVVPGVQKGDVYVYQDRRALGTTQDRIEACTPQWHCSQRHFGYTKGQ